MDFYEEDEYLCWYDYDSENHAHRLFYRTLSNLTSPTSYDFVTASHRWDFKAPVVNAFREMPGFNINADDENENTALFMAVVRSDEATVKLLISLGINVNHMNRYGSTALMYCVSHGEWTPMTELLIKAGADVNIANNSGNTALMYAIVRNNAENVEIILKAGANVRALNNEYFGTRAFLKRRNRRNDDTDVVEKLVIDAHQRLRYIKNVALIDCFVNDDIIKTIQKYI